MTVTETETEALVEKPSAEETWLDTWLFGLRQTSRMLHADPARHDAWLAATFEGIHEMHTDTEIHSTLRARPQRACTSRRWHEYHSAISLEPRS